MTERSRILKIGGSALAVLSAISALSNVSHLSTRIDVFHPASGLYTVPAGTHVVIMWRVEGLNAKAWLNGDSVGLDDSEDFQIATTRTFTLASSGLVGSDTRRITITATPANNQSAHGQRKPEAHPEGDSPAQPAKDNAASQVPIPIAPAPTPPAIAKSPEPGAANGGAGSGASPAAPVHPISTGYLTISVEPAGSSIEVSGLGSYLNGATDVSCPSGTYTITARHPFMSAESRSVVVSSGQHATVDIRMTPDQQALQAEVKGAAAKAMGGDPNGAIQTLKGVLDIDPNNRPALSVLSVAYFQSRNIAGFQAAATQAVRHGATVPVQLVHAHGPTAAMLHPTLVGISASSISFKPVPAGCNLPANPLSLAFVESANVVTDVAGETFLQIKLRNSPGGARLGDVRLWAPGVRSAYRPVKQGLFVSNQNVLSSPPDAAAMLGAVAQVIHEAMAMPRQ